ncbi:MAG TPA: hypothetical protein VG370_11340 [Chloroflexota bacterium]|nr:hypothetical protein [Chloroflexota bacterium]
MTDFWQVGPAEAEHRLRLAGFSAGEAEGLVALRLRCDAVDVGALSEEQRMAVLRWLLEHGRRDEGWPRGHATGSEMAA